MARIDLDKDENLTSTKEVDVGFAVKAILQSLKNDSKVSQLQLLGFFTECKKFLKTTTSKILERCPLKYPIFRNLTALDPQYIASHPKSALSKFEKLLDKLMECKRLSPSECDVAKEQYVAFVSDVKKYHKEEFSTFSTEQRLDTFFYQNIGEKEETGMLWKVVKMMMLLSHGQADIERGFSINKEVASDNMDETTIIAYRRAYDGVLVMGFKEVHEMPISAEMMQSCRYSRHRYDMASEEKKKQRKATEAQEKTRQLTTKLNECKKKAELEKETEKLLKKSDKLAEDAEKHKKWQFLIESNALKEKGKAKKREISKTEEDIEALEKKIKLKIDSVEKLISRVAMGWL